MPATLAGLAAAVAAADGAAGAVVAAAIAAGAADAAAAEAAGAEAAAAEAATLAAAAAAIEAAATPAPARAAAALHDLARVAAVALTDGDAYARAIALHVPPSNAPRIADDVLALLPAQAPRQATQAAHAAVALQRLRERARDAAGIAAAISAALSPPQQASAPPAEQPQEQAPPAAPVTLLCALDGARVQAPAAALTSLGVPRNVFDISDDARPDAHRTAAAQHHHPMPPLPVAGSQLALLLAFLDAAPGARMSQAAAIAAGADGLAGGTLLLR
jgi:hypothetical protein